MCAVFVEGFREKVAYNRRGKEKGRRTGGKEGHGHGRRKRVAWKENQRTWLERQNSDVKRTKCGKWGGGKTYVRLGRTEQLGRETTTAVCVKNADDVFLGTTVVGGS